MSEKRSQKPEEQVWKMYLEKCKLDGTKPNAKDFAEWTKTLLANL